MTDYYYITWPLELAAPIPDKPGRVRLQTRHVQIPCVTRTSYGDVGAQEYFARAITHMNRPDLCNAICNEPYGVFRAVRGANENVYELRWTLEPKS